MRHLHFQFPTVVNHAFQSLGNPGALIGGGLSLQCGQIADLLNLTLEAALGKAVSASPKGRGAPKSRTAAVERRCLRSDMSDRVSLVFRDEVAGSNISIKVSNVLLHLESRRHASKLDIEGRSTIDDTDTTILQPLIL